jgi:2-methylcitrate dehydratase
VEVEYPLGHRRRREEAIPLLLRKFRKNIAASMEPEREEMIADLFLNQQRLEAMSVCDFMELFTPPGYI